MKKVISLLCATALMISCLCVSPIFGTFADAKHMTDIVEVAGTTVVDGETVSARFFGTNVSEDGVGDAPFILAEYVIEKDGKKATGSAEIYDAYKSITLGSNTITSDSIKGGREGDYVIGILFINVEPSDKIEVTFDGIGKDTTNDTTFAAQGKGVGNTTLRGIEVEDIDGDGVIRVACVGDSITAGTADTNYPKYLQEYLNELGKKNGKKYEVKNHGKGGAACRHVEETVDNSNSSWHTVTDANGDGKAYFYYDDVSYQSSLTYTPDIVIVQIGTNDALFDNWANWDNYFNNDYYNYLVKPYADKGALVVLSTPPYACNGWHDENCNGPVHDKEVQLAWDLNLPIVDTNRLMYGMKDYFADGLHGNEAGYRYMALNFYKYIFGGNSVSGTVNTVANATVKLTDKATGTIHTAQADANGKVTFDFMEGKDYSFDVEVICEGYKRNTGVLNVKNGTGSVDISLEKGDYVVSRGAATSCSTENTESGRTANKVVDDDTTSDGSRWECAESDAAAWIQLDLGKVYKSDAIRVYWETAAASKYNVKISKDGTNWETFYVDYGAAGMVRTNFNKECDVRYVRIECIEKVSSKYRYSIFEIEVLTQNKP